MPSKATSAKKGGASKGKEKKLQRKKELDQENATNNSIKAAYAKANPLAEFPAFLSFNRNGLSADLLLCRADGLSPEIQTFITALLEANMAPFYGDEWSAVKKLKALEMLESDALYILAMPAATSPSPSTQPGGGTDSSTTPASRDASIDSSAENNNAVPLTSVSGTRTDDGEDHVTGIAEPLNAAGGKQKFAGEDDVPAGEATASNVGRLPLAFAQFRFLIEEGVELLYVYELQLAEAARRKGLGRHLMVLMELVARKNQMKGVMLTCQKSNEASMRFYGGLGYQVDEISPSKCDPLADEDEYSYEILSKRFTPR